MPFYETVLDLTESADMLGVNRALCGKPSRSAELICLIGIRNPDYLVALTALLKESVYLILVEHKRGLLR